MATLTARVPDELLAKMDEAASIAGTTRTGWLLGIIEGQLGTVAPEALERVRLEEPPKPKKLTTAAMARRKNNGAKIGALYETSAEFRERAGIKPNVPKDPK